MNKKGFTFAEVIIVFSLIAIITTIGISTVAKPWELAYKYAYNNIYNSLGTAIFSKLVSIPDGTTGDSPFPANSKVFCKVIAQSMNIQQIGSTYDTANCETAADINSNNPELSSFIDSSAKKLSDAHKNVKIELQNGVKLWIGSNNGKPFEYTEKKGSESFGTVKYYIVYADINGQRKPNTFEYKDKKLPDIVAFAVTDKFTVVPLGYPTVSKKYLTTYIMYPSYDDEEEVATIPSDGMTYYEAKVKTFGTYTTSGSLNKIRIVSEGILDSYDFENNVFKSGNGFRIGNIKNFINPMPEFDKTNCGQGCTIQAGDVDGLKCEELTSSYCEIKIYEVN